MFGRYSMVCLAVNCFGGKKMKHYLLLMALPLVMVLPVSATAQDTQTPTDVKDYYFDPTLVAALAKGTRLSAKQQTLLTAGLNQERCADPCFSKVLVRTKFADAWKGGDRSRATIVEIRNDVISQLTRDMGIMNCGACPGSQAPSPL